MSAAHVLDRAEQTSLMSGALDVYRACDPEKQARLILDDVSAIIARYIDFDIATFVEYAADPDDDKVALCLGRYAIYKRAHFDWPARWLRIPSKLISVPVGQTTAISSLGAFLSDPASQTLHSNPIITAYLERHAQGLLAALYWQDGQLAASLTLARTSQVAFTDEDRAILEALVIPEALRRVWDAYRTQAAAFRQEILGLFLNGQASPEEIAGEAMERLCRHFRWSYAAIFRISHLRGRFELVRQHNASNSRLLVPPDYTQDLRKGALGKARKSGEPVLIEDTHRADKKDYEQVSKDGRSCLCYPIKLDGSVEWILDCESAEVGAFQHPDQLELGELIGGVQKTVSLWFEMRLNRALLENIGEGVVVVDRRNRITRLNTKARQLLGSMPGTHPRRLLGAYLQNFGSDEISMESLKAGSTAIKQFRLKQLNGEPRNVAGSSSEADDAFSRRIWRFTETRTMNWVTALDYMRGTVQGVAQQTRGPLLLAKALLAKAHRLGPGDGEVQTLLAEAGAWLAKADITYERLVVGLEVRHRPQGNPVAVDVASALQRFLASLPREDSSAVLVTCVEDAPAAWIDPGRLDFVLHSLLGHLLMVRAPASEIELKLGGDIESISVTFSCPVPEASEDKQALSAEDPLAFAEANAREAATAALDAIRDVIVENGGTWTYERSGVVLNVCFCLPSANVSKMGEETEGGSYD